MGNYKFYAVARGHKVGVFEQWADAQTSIAGFTGAMFKGFQTREEADEFIDKHKK